MKNTLILIASFIIFSLIFNGIIRYLISKDKLKFKIPKETKGKVIWVVICCTIYIIGYVLIDFLGLGIVGFNIARGFLLAILISLLMISTYKKK
ncbi:hypothetical protein E5347_01280 [Clostridium sartagoforme]|uniref:Uncharacterized protein n=1 Tax=Clostridium sartagoforme TaxID=84031 RepID=A0A4S2DQZ6_9CLOT|nr:MULTISPECIES: hypothetical protein [Clostridium]MBS5936948.1 hypothetical protein [Clostridium sp.]TGY43471.1 hypothetical protein E5347_01280 [Clostridium sartagoforme]